MRGQSIEEVADDSEPERVALRAKCSAVNALREHQDRVPNTDGNLHLHTVPGDVIEISGTWDLHPPVSTVYSTEDTESLSPPQSQSLTVKHFNPKYRFRDPSTTQLVISETTSPSDYHQEASRKLTLDIKQFSFQDDRRQKLVPTSGEKRLVSSASRENSDGVAHQQHPTKLKVGALLPEAELSKLLCCICCDIKWTARKTNLQKSNHIRSCAKKHAFDDETVEFLLGKAIAKSPSALQPPKRFVKLKDPCTQPSLEEQTFVEDLLGDNSRKKSKRPSKSLLRSPSFTRDNIMTKAQNILSAASRESSPPTFRPLPGTLPLNRGPKAGTLPSTQPFGYSTLGQCTNGRSSLVFSPLPSSLSASLWEDNHDNHNFHDLSNIHNSPFTPTKQGWEPTTMTTTTSAVQQNKRERGAKSAKKLTSEFNREWQLHVKQAIVQDEELHLRVLRYEPIHFDVFLKIAESYAPGHRKFRLHLRSFLDAQAIHFYGAEAPKGRQR